MSPKIGGQRPCPRVALLGRFPRDALQEFVRLFPTIWPGDTIEELKEKVDVREVDLMIIGRGIEWASDWPAHVHVICFSENLNELPGPTSKTKITRLNRASTEEFVLPDIPLPLSRRRDADFHDVSSVRGWWRLRLEPVHSGACSQSEIENAVRALYDGAIICELQPLWALATQHVRENKLGMAWLPCALIDQAAWVDVLVTQWAQFDKKCFPHFGDWTASPEWMVPEEEDIIASIEALEQQKQSFIAQIDQQVGELESKRAAAKVDANRGRRRLITAKEDELVDEVKKVFQEIGFEVDDMDELLAEEAQRREDLRLRDPSGRRESWEAIVEVRGYARSGGKTEDLMRLARFANLYERETGRQPDKRIYVVNGQLELLPPQRQSPLAAAEGDVKEFAESDGLVIWTLDLFRAMKATNPKDYSTLRKSIREAVSIWQAVS